jgi:hypothetical protein
MGLNHGSAVFQGPEAVGDQMTGVRPVDALAYNHIMIQF